ncbi:SGS-domain-containing protein [Melanomma pulvis-pyrius CBS 109.77]|uniref:SGS-domain-containing protein n=1 Tax=Melanomma pulvis-pyrius CBS 109.77 TaxID=1314802 RepID=A0A6A6XCN9_9PLEO|nr:SGS-domain-containing protein [Melanomma pulvis-pyrius CBS 109.77]
MDQAARGAAALAASNYEDAIKLYTSAIAVNSNAVDYYIKRSTAYQRSAKYSEALADAEAAVVLAHKRARRELIKDSQLRRGIALFFLERYADAEFVLGIVKRLDEKEKTLGIWNMKVAAKLKTLEDGDDRGKVTAKEVPESKEINVVDTPMIEGLEKEAGAIQKRVVQTPADKIKHDWYQNNENVYFTLLAKGVPKDLLTVEIEKDSLSISFPIQDASDYGYTLDPLFAPIDPANSTFRTTPTKIEVTLKKATPGVKWHDLEGDRDTSDPSEEKTSVPAHVLRPKTNEQPPVYPTSSKKGVKNWDKVATDLSSKKEGEPDDDEEGDETARFFKSLYKGAAPDAQRAMMKSYQESGGTVLSTDWKDVGSKTIVPQPPDGMEAKKY